MTHLRLFRLGLFMIIPGLILDCSGGKPKILEQKCNSCHSSSLVYQRKRPMAEWDLLLYGMKARGLKITPEEEKEIHVILSQRLSKD